MVNKIKEIICPHCRKNLMNLKYDRHPGMSKLSPSKWECADCVIVYPFGWFERFTQYEFLVLRQGGSLNKWLKNLEVDKKIMLRMKSNLIKKNGRSIN